MSQEFFDPELFADFIAEAKEHLETIEPNLLELEKAPTNLALLNDIFRPMHSLKGASGFLGLNRINQLAHKSENILDELRKGSMVVTSEIMDVILASTDALRQMIDNLEASNAEGDVETEHIIAQIDAIMAGENAPAASPPSASPPPVAEAPAEATAAGKSEIETPEPPGDDAAGRGASSNADDDAGGISTKEWIASLPPHEPYALAAFGEGHLKDFIDESSDIIGSLNDGLLKLEENPTGQDELVHDIFRFFHNMKGNSGIIGYNELNALTHEAETLLNNVRQGKIEASHELIDLLLLVVDTLEALVQHIDISGGVASPFDTTSIIKQLQEVLNGGPIALPPELVQAQRGRGQGAKAAGAEVGETAEDATDKKDAPSSGAPVAPVIIPAGTEGDDVDVFRVTVRQQMEIIRAALETLKQDGAHKDSIDALYRCLVAVKNACAFVGQTEIKTYAERTAGIVDQGRKSDIDFGMMVDLLSQETGIIDDMVQKALTEGKIGAKAHAAEAAAEVTAAPAAPGQAQAKPGAEGEAAGVSGEQAGRHEPPAKAAAPATPDAGRAKAATPKAAPPQANAAAQDAHKSSSTIRVDHERLDHLMNLIGELIINRNRYTLIARSLEGDRDVDIAQVAQSLSETTYAMARISDDLQDTIMKVRMVPVSSVFSRFPRLVRDLSRKSGKEVDLIMEGEETELDKSVVEVIGDPLVHLIRNSVDHGVEPEDVRIAAGKSPKGKVTLRAFHKGNSVAIEIEDDGKGIDPEKMREVAVRKGVITAEEAAQLDDREAVELIFAPGFSSAEKITDISGRGVGMDVVRTNIKNLKGSVSTYSEVGKGTRFTLSLPLTLAIIDALMVNVAGQMYAIPLDAVSETTKIEAERLTDLKGRKAVTLRGEVLGIVEFSEMLGLPKAAALPEVLSVVVIHDNERRLGLVVDRLLERQEIVIKPLGAYLGDLKGISGATIMGDGSVILILDPHEIYLMATSKAASISGSDSAKQQGVK
ncbi:MAG: Hpt domain-containing protein [Desulfovibrio sp.]|jgi:two-component system chemotaxis sensor kinase CheA|nr:Hpt domain-containing protein [Desulfovibrio sp.]